MNGITTARRLPVGAEPHASGVDFRVWAPARQTVEVVTPEAAVPLHPEGDGYFSGLVEHARPGTLYRYRLDGRDEFPDPASRFQPEGPHGPSQVVDPSTFWWTDTSWQGLPLEGQVIYEMHAGAFTREGTFQAALGHLPELQRIGITVIEVMPVADFSGRFGWGYDGVNWFAPTRLYGTPDDFRAFIDRAHSLGMSVILDVVYNHFGADGNYTGQFSPHYLSKIHTTDWGDALNYDGPHSAAVREYVIANATHWIAEYHLDGIRLDATQNVVDDSPVHILSEVTAAVRRAAPGRRTIVVAENEPQEVKLVGAPERGGFGMDGVWNDDFHHSAIVALTGRSESYYTDYKGSAQELLSAMKYGYLYQGQWYDWQQKRRGTPAFRVPPSAFITYIQNHDQVANSISGLRAHQRSAPGVFRAMTAILLLGPGTPMLFQGQEFGASTPFLFFADMPEYIRDIVRKGRKEFMSQWPTLRAPEMAGEFHDPCAPDTFDRCKLDRSKADPALSALHCDLLRLRRTDPVISNQRRGSFDGAVLSERAFVYRIFNDRHGDRLLLVNLGADLLLYPASEPLLAPPQNGDWTIVFSTEHPRYGGSGTPPYESEQNWRLLSQSAVLLAPAAGENRDTDSGR